MLPHTSSFNNHGSEIPCDKTRNLRKRKRSPSTLSNDLKDGNRVDTSLLEGEDDEASRKFKKTKVEEVHVTGIRPPGLSFPKSAYRGHVPPLPRYSEESVLRDIVVS